MAWQNRTLCPNRGVDVQNAPSIWLTESTPMNKIQDSRTKRRRIEHESKSSLDVKSSYQISNNHPDMQTSTFGKSGPLLEDAESFARRSPHMREEQDAKPYLGRKSAHLLGQTATMPFIIEDGSDEEEEKEAEREEDIVTLIPAPGECHTNLQLRTHREHVDLQRQQSRYLRDQALSRRSRADRCSPLSISIEQEDPIDLCSSRSPSRGFGQDRYTDTNRSYPSDILGMPVDITKSDVIPATRTYGPGDQHLMHCTQREEHIARNVRNDSERRQCNSTVTEATNQSGAYKNLQHQPSGRIANSSNDDGLPNIQAKVINITPSTRHASVISRQSGISPLEKRTTDVDEGCRNTMSVSQQPNDFDLRETESYRATGTPQTDRRHTAKINETSSFDTKPFSGQGIQQEERRQMAPSESRSEIGDIATEDRFSPDQSQRFDRMIDPYAQRKEERISRMRLRNEQNRKSASSDDIDYNGDVDSSAASSKPLHSVSSMHPPNRHSNFEPAQVQHSKDAQAPSRSKQREILEVEEMGLSGLPSSQPMPPTTNPDIESTNLSVSALGRNNSSCTQAQIHRVVDPVKWRHHKRVLGEIMIEDIQLIIWRRNGVEWPEVAQLFETFSGKKRQPATLEKRVRQVKNAFKDAGILESLVDQAASGDVKSLRQINNQIREKLSNGNAKADAELHRSYEETKGHQSPIKTLASSTAPSRVTSQPIEVPQTAIQSRPHIPDLCTSHFSSEKAEQNRNFDRPTAGGKFINWDNWLHVLHVQPDCSDTEEDRSAGSQEQGDEIDAEDFCHFIYRIERREIWIEDFCDDPIGEDIPWIECCSDFESLAAANTAAALQVYRSSPGKPRFANPEGDFCVTQRTNEHGLKTFTLENQELGTVEVRVRRSMRSFHDGILPTCGDSMIRRTGYLVKWKVTKKSYGDGLFEESKESVQSGIVDAIFTVVGIANQQAAQQFVEMTFESMHVNLNVRRQKKQEMMRDLLDAMQADDELFEETSGEGTNKKVEVWVETLPVKGPRNLL